MSDCRYYCYFDGQRKMNEDELDCDNFHSQKHFYQQCYLNEKTLSIRVIAAATITISLTELSNYSHVSTVLM